MRSNDKPRLARGLTLALVVLASLAQAPAKPEGEAPRDDDARRRDGRDGEVPRLVVGAVLPTSGAQAAFGREAMRGLELARAALVREDARLASKLVLRTGDDRSLVSEAARVEAELAGKSGAPAATVLVGSMSGPSTTALATAAAAGSGAVVVAPLATQDGVTGAGRFFRTVADESMQARLVARYVVSDWKVAKLALITDASAASKALAKAFEDGATGATVVAREEIKDAAGLGANEALTRVKAAGATAVLAAVGYADAASLMKQAQAIGLKARFAGIDHWDTPELARLAGKAGVGHAFATHFAVDDPDPAAAAFTKAFSEAYKRPPGVVAALAYDALGVVVAAMRRENAAQPEALARALARTRGYAGATGVIDLGDGGAYAKSVAIKTLAKDGARFTTRVGP